MRWPPAGPPWSPPASRSVFFGVLSSHSASRSQVVPAPVAAPLPEQDKPKKTSKYVRWSELLRRVFGIETVCQKCQTRLRLLRLIALIKTEDIARKILTAMHLPTELGPAHPAPAPRGFAAPVAELHPARPPPRAPSGGDDWVN